MKPFTNIAAILLAFIACIHVVRLIKGAEVVVNAMVVPLWVSGIAAFLTGGLAIMIWRESQRG